MRPTVNSERLSTQNGVALRTQWQPGPGAKPGGPVLVSFTDFRVRGFRHLLPVSRTATAVRREWGTRRGSLGLALWVRPLDRRLGSLSAWESEEDLQRWIGSDDHGDAVRANKAHMWNIASATWETDNFVLAEAWQEAERRQRAGESNGI